MEQHTNEQVSGMISTCVDLERLLHEARKALRDKISAESEEIGPRTRHVNKRAINFSNNLRGAYETYVGEVPEEIRYLLEQEHISFKKYNIDELVGKLV